jgi:hypothetical protein
VAWFTPAGGAATFLDRPLPGPLWRAPGLEPDLLTAFREGWEEQKVVAPAKPSDLTIREYRAGESRDFASDFAFCRKQSFALLRIEDPFALSGAQQFGSLCRFLDELGKLWEKAPTKLEIKTRDSGLSEQRRMISELATTVKAYGTVLDVRCVVTSGPRRTDFHDRRLIFQPDSTNHRRRVIVLLTGGIDRYLYDKFECGIITHHIL